MGGDYCAHILVAFLVENLKDWAPLIVLSNKSFSNSSSTSLNNDFIWTWSKPWTTEVVHSRQDIQMMPYFLHILNDQKLSGSLNSDMQTDTYVPVLTAFIFKIIPLIYKSATSFTQHILGILLLEGHGPHIGPHRPLLLTFTWTPPLLSPSWIISLTNLFNCPVRKIGKTIVLFSSPY